MVMPLPVHEPKHVEILFKSVGRNLRFNCFSYRDPPCNLPRRRDNACSSAYLSPPFGANPYCYGWPSIGSSRHASNKRDLWLSQCTPDRFLEFWKAGDTC